MLEPCEGRLSHTVLRGRGGGNAALLPNRGGLRGRLGLPSGLWARALCLGRAAGEPQAVGRAKATENGGAIVIKLMGHKRLPRRARKPFAFLMGRADVNE